MKAPTNETSLCYRALQMPWYRWVTNADSQFLMMQVRRAGRLHQSEAFSQIFGSGLKPSSMPVSLRQSERGVASRPGVWTDKLRHRTNFPLEQSRIVLLYF